MEQQEKPHFLLVTYPAQGHINPALQFAKRLIRIGARVTFATTVHVYRRMANSPTPTEALSFASFSDGFDDGFDPTEHDPAFYVSEMKRRGIETLTELLEDSQNQLGDGQPFTCLIYTLLLPWVTQVAGAFHLPAALLWLEPALVFDVYHYYFHGFADYIKQKEANDLIELPGLPPLTCRDLPSFLDPTKSSPYAFIIPAFKEQMETVAADTNPRILINTFDALEVEALRAVDKFDMIGIGPLLPPAFLDSQDQSDTGYGGDIFKVSSEECHMEWLNSKPKASVIYVSFGSICVLENRQMEEIARGLLESGHPFLWVIREKDNKNKDEEGEVTTTYREELNQKGMTVPWCSQVEVLSHEAVGCFVTHCGWNSSLESLVCGVPVVAFPQWTDQGTNAKILVDICRTGVRVKPNGDGIVEGNEMTRCLELVMGKGQEFRLNALKWKDSAREAVKAGGSSDRNLKAFVHQIQL